jgi:hypothetical protein
MIDFEGRQSFSRKRREGCRTLKKPADSFEQVEERSKIEEKASKIEDGC